MIKYNYLQFRHYYSLLKIILTLVFSDLRYIIGWFSMMLLTLFVNILPYKKINLKFIESVEYILVMCFNLSEVTLRYSNI